MVALEKLSDLAPKRWSCQMPWKLERRSLALSLSLSLLFSPL